MVYVTSRPLYPFEITPVSTEKKAELTPGIVWTGVGEGGKLLPPPGFDLWTVHIVAIRYTD
jgi:hypothetical protein